MGFATLLKWFEQRGPRIDIYLFYLQLYKVQAYVQLETPYQHLWLKWTKTSPDMSPKFLRYRMYNLHVFEPQMWKWSHM